MQCAVHVLADERGEELKLSKANLLPPLLLSRPLYSHQLTHPFRPPSPLHPARHTVSVSLHTRILLWGDACGVRVPLSLASSSPLVLPPFPSSPSHSAVTPCDERVGLRCSLCGRAEWCVRSSGPGQQDC